MRRFQDSRWCLYRHAEFLAHSAMGFRALSLASSNKLYIFRRISLSIGNYCLHGIYVLKEHLMDQNKFAHTLASYSQVAYCMHDANMDCIVLSVLPCRQCMVAPFLEYWEPLLPRVYEPNEHFDRPEKICSHPRLLLSGGVLQPSLSARQLACTQAHLQGTGEWVG